MSHYYDKEQSGPLNEQKIEVKGKPFFTASGLFSKDHLDNATKLLIEKCELENAKEVLDLGCGWGVVAVLLKLQNKDLSVTASDTSKRAIQYTKKNARINKVDIEVIEADVLSGVEKNFDVILTNPPYVAGRKVTFAFVDQSFEHLNKGGSLQLVARHQKGGKMLGEHMKEVFGNCEHIAKSGGFRIYKSVKE